MKQIGIKIQAGVRYWCDCQYSTDNGITWNQPDDTDEDDLKVRNSLPCVEYFEKQRNWYWCLNIDYVTGRVENWRNGVFVKAFFNINKEIPRGILPVG